MVEGEARASSNWNEEGGEAGSNRDEEEPRWRGWQPAAVKVRKDDGDTTVEMERMRV